MISFDLFPSIFSRFRRLVCGLDYRASAGSLIVFVLALITANGVFFLLDNSRSHSLVSSLPPSIPFLLRFFLARVFTVSPLN